MASKRKSAGIRVYNLLRKEVGAINKTLPVNKQLTRKQQYKFISEKIYPQYKGKSQSTIRKKPLRDFVGKKITRYKASQKRSSVYNRVVKEVATINRNLPENRRLGRSELYEFVSKKIYPKYKGLPKSQLRIEKLRDFIFNKIQWIPRKKGCNVIAIPLDKCQDIPYYEVEDFIRQVLPPCINMQVNGDGFGGTKIFNTRDFSYYASGVADITNAINEHVSRRPNRRGISPGQRYFGEIQLIPNKPNDGDPENYYLEMVLRGEDVEQEEKPRIKPPKRKKRSKRQKFQERSIKEYIRERLSNMKTQKSKIKGIRHRLEVMIYKFNQNLKGVGLTKEAKNTILKALQYLTQLSF